MNLIRLLSPGALLVAIAPVAAQSLEQTFYTRDELIAAVRYAAEADEEEVRLVRELHDSYFEESKEDFAQTYEEAGRLTKQLIEGHLTEEAFQKERAPLCDAYSERQSARDRALLTDLDTLLGNDEEESRAFVRLLEHLRALRPDAEGGGSCHPLRAWSLAFPDDPLPAEAAQVCHIYSNCIDELFAARTALEETPPGRSERAVALQGLRQLRIRASIDAASDACAEQLAGLLAPGEARRYLQTYYRLRSPRYFNTPVDARLASIDVERLDEAARQRIEEYHSRYWRTLRALNQTVLDAHKVSGERGIEISIDKSVADLRAAQAEVIKAKTEREEQLKLLLGELEQILRTIEQKDPK